MFGDEGNSVEKKLPQVKIYTTSEEDLITLELALVDHNHAMFEYFKKEKINSKIIINSCVF